MREQLGSWLGWTGARPDVARGLRAATCTVAPILAAHVLHRPGLALMALGGWLGALADAGGAYGTRARSIAAFVVGGAVSGFVATLAGRSLWAALPAMFVWGFGGSLLRAFGAPGGTLGTLLTVAFAVSLARPGDLHAAVLAGANLSAGGLLAMALALSFWPVHPHKPVRRAVAAAYARLAVVTRAVQALVAEGAAAGDPRWHANVRNQHRALRDAIEAARRVSGATRSRRPGPSAHGDALRVFTEGVDQLFGVIIAAAEEFESAGAPDPSAATALARFAEVFEAIGTTLERRVTLPDPTLLDAALAALAGDVASTPSGHRTSGARVLARGGEFVHAAYEAAEVLTGRATRTVTGVPTPRDSLAPVALGTTLREAFRTDALPFQHGVRVGIAAAASVALTAVLPIRRGYWLTLTVITVLQPSAGLTRGRGVQRALGTVIGGVFAALLSVFVHDPIVKLALMFPLSVAAIAVQPLSYGLFTLFLTPVFVLLSEQTPGDWHLAGLRIAYTVLGGALAFVAASVLWPSWEGQRLRAALATMMRANRDYLRAVSDRWLRGGAPPGAILGARRRLGVAVNEADAAFERSIGTPRADPEHVEAVQTLLTYARRLAGAITAMGSSSQQGAPPPEGLAETVARWTDVMTTLADALDEGRALPGEATTSTDEGAHPPALARVIRSVTVMDRAVRRMNA